MSFAPIKLSELAEEIRRTLEDSFAGQVFWVMADVTNHSFYSQKKHHYFDLVEKGKNGIISKIQAVAWADGDRHIRAFETTTGQAFKNDIHVLVCVRVDFHVVYGLKLTLIDIDTRFTLGQLEEQRQATLIRLLTECPGYIRKEGDFYITLNKELSFRKVLQHIAVVASQSSAGYEDFMHTLLHNDYGFRFHIDPYFTKVQGQDNAEEVALRITEAVDSGKPYDAIVIIRGGGSQTDFLIFDQFILAMAVAKCPIPVITGIGHQRNETITDMMAHTVTKTPTQSAELLIAHNRQFEESLITLQKNLLLKVQQLIARKIRDLNSLNSSVTQSVQHYLRHYKDELVHFYQVVINNSRNMLFDHKSRLMHIGNAMIMKPRKMVDGRKMELLHTISMLKSFQLSYLKNQKGYLNHFVTFFRMASPVNIMKRGFALIKVNGKIVSDADNIEQGKPVTIILKESEIESIVTSKKGYNGKDFDI